MFLVGGGGDALALGRGKVSERGHPLTCEENFSGAASSGGEIKKAKSTRSASVLVKEGRAGCLWREPALD